MGFPTRITSVDGQTGTVDLTKADVGLANVDNTSDATKNTATATLTNKTLTSPVVNTPTGIVKGDVGLGNVDNTSDTNKPVSTAQLTAIRDRSNEVISTTWANRATAISAIAALTPAEGYVRVTDIGPNGTTWWCNGTTLVREDEFLLTYSNLSWILPSLTVANAATYSQSGTDVTVTAVAHNIPNSTSLNGGNVWLSPLTGTAAEGWYTNFQYVSANSFTCVSAASLTTSGTLTTQTGVTRIATMFTIPGGLLGTKGICRIDWQGRHLNSAGTKIYQDKIANSLIHGYTATATLSVSATRRFRNLTASSQLEISCPESAVGYNASVSGFVTSTEDTTTDKAITKNMQLNTASEYQALIGFHAYITKLD